MRRVSLIYGGRDYMIPGRTADDVCDEIEQKLTAGVPTWLFVAASEGRHQEARLLIQPGVDIAVHPLDEGNREQGGQDLGVTTRAPYFPEDVVPDK